MNGDDQIDPRLQQAVHTTLERAAADIDPASVARLRAARRRAVAAAERPRARHWRWLAASVPVAAVVALAVLVADPSPIPPSTPLAAASGEVVRDLDLLTSGENLELLDDLEFYRWLPAERSS